MNAYLLERLREERGKLPPRPPIYRTVKRKSTFIDHNDYTAEYVRKSPNQQPNNNQEVAQALNNFDNNAFEEKGPQLVKKK